MRDLLRELHSLPAMPGREAGLLQVGVRARRGKDDEDGEHVEASLDAQRPHVRTYTVEGGVLYDTRIRNLGEQAVTLTPVYYAATAATGVRAAPEEVDRQETITLQAGEEREWFPVQLDVDGGERETGWKFEAEGEGVQEALLVLHVRLAPPGQ